VVESIGRYELLKRLAIGGMAEVFLARQSGPVGFTKLVVLKRILPQLAAQPRFVNMFLDEARLAARFNHPNVVQIYDLGRENDAFYIAMEYIHGEDLKAIVRRCSEVGRRIPNEHIVKIFSGVLDGLFYAHTQQDLEGRPQAVVHRDVSPHNVLVGYQGGVKLIDFGIAKARSEISTTVPGKVKGKHAYMSPEQVRGQELDGRSDLFAVGIVMYELLTWTRLFKRVKPLETLQAVTSDPVTPIRELNPNVPAELERIVMKALDRDPGRRYATAREMQLELEEFLLQAGLRSNPALLAVFMQELFDEKVRARSKALTMANAQNLESAVLGARQGTPDLVSFLDQFFAPVTKPDNEPGSAPEFTPSSEEASAQPSEAIPAPVGPIPVLGSEVPPRRSAPPSTAPSLPAVTPPGLMPTPAPKAPPGLELLMQAPGTRAPRAPTPAPAPAPRAPAPAATPRAPTPAPRAPTPAPRAPTPAPQPAPPEVAPLDLGPAYGAQDLLEIDGLKKGGGLRTVLILGALLLVVAGVVAVVLFQDELFPPAKPTTCTLKVTSEPAGAMVFLGDDRQPGETPLEIGYLEPGTQLSVRVSKDGFEDFTQQVTVQDPAVPVEIAAVLKSRGTGWASKVAGPPVVGGAEGQGRGGLKIASQPAGAVIYLDGVDIGRKTPAVLKGITAGVDHLVMVELEGNRLAVERVKLTAEQTTELQLALSDPLPPPPTARIKVTFETEPDKAKVIVNGFPIGKKTPVGVALLLGAASDIEIELDGYKTWEGRVRPVPDVDLTVYIPLTKKR